MQSAAANKLPLGYTPASENSRKAVIDTQQQAEIFRTQRLASLMEKKAALGVTDKKINDVDHDLFRMIVDLENLPSYFCWRHHAVNVEGAASDVVIEIPTWVAAIEDAAIREYAEYLVSYVNSTHCDGCKRDGPVMRRSRPAAMPSGLSSLINGKVSARMSPADKLDKHRIKLQRQLTKLNALNTRIQETLVKISKAERCVANVAKQTKFAEMSPAQQRQYTIERNINMVLDDGDDEALDAWLSSRSVEKRKANLPTYTDEHEIPIPDSETADTIRVGTTNYNTKVDKSDYFDYVSQTNAAQDPPMADDEAAVYSPIRF